MLAFKTFIKVTLFKQTFFFQTKQKFSATQCNVQVYGVLWEYIHGLMVCLNLDRIQPHASMFVLLKLLLQFTQVI